MIKCSTNIIQIIVAFIATDNLNFQLAYQYSSVEDIEILLPQAAFTHIFICMINLTTQKQIIHAHTTMKHFLHNRRQLSGERGLHIMLRIREETIRDHKSYPF